jgi:hypothetical protein
MECRIAGVGVRGPGVRDFPELTALFKQDSDQPLAATESPKPERIPARERRRSPLAARLAIEVADQACSAAGVDPSQTACVFASGAGDTTITDYMCRALDSEDMLLSPTRFHNSVHNAPVGYWTITTGCHQPANSVSGFLHTFPVALLEAACQCVVENTPVLLVAQDIASPPPFVDLLNVVDSFAVALVLLPGGGPRQLNLERHNTPVSWPGLEQRQLTAIYDSNPAARSLPLLGSIAIDRPTDLVYPVDDNGSLNLEYRP